MAMLIGKTSSAPDYPEALAAATRSGWQVVSEGPSGAQLRRPKRLGQIAKGLLIVGLVLLLDWRIRFLLADPYWQLGLLFCSIAAADYFFNSPSKAVFLSRATPHRVS